INRSKSLNLFGQSVGIKVLGNIDDFIRQHLLDEPDIEGDFRDLKNNFNDLTEALQNIEKAECQQQLLAPIVENSRQLTTLKADLFLLEQAAECVEPWFAQHKIGLIEAERNVQQERLKKTKHDLETLESTLASLRDEESELRSQLKSSDTGREIAQLEREIRELENSKKQKKEKADRYAEHVRLLGSKWVGEPDAALFFAQLSKAQNEKDRLRTEQDTQRTLRDDIVADLNTERAKRKNIETELDSLELRPNNLPAQLVSVRDQIAEVVGIAPELLPFVGELLQVKPEECEQWEAALEKLLGSFARFVIVPSEHYRAVNQAVRSRDLGLLFRYYEVKPGAPPYIPKDTSLDRANNKVDILPKTPHKNWLVAQLRDRFDHLCTADAETFTRTQRAITPEGLLRNGDRNEKDDSRRGRHQFVLGWNNDDKKRELKRLRHEIQQQIEKNKARQKGLDDKLADLTDQSHTLTALLQFTSFGEIDHRSDAEAIAEKKAGLNDLHQSSDDLQHIQKQLDSISEKIKKAGTEQREAFGVEADLKQKLDALRRDQLHCQETLDRATPPDHAPLLPFMEKLGYDLALDNIENAKRTIIADIRQQQTSKEGEKNKTVTRLVSDMVSFKHSPKDAQGNDRFPRWVNDTAQLPERPDVEFVSLYTDLHERITADELPGQRERFARMMSTDITNQMSHFVKSLERKLTDIKEAIEDINASLRSINPDQFLQLLHKDNNKGRAGEFRSMLTGWRYDIGEFQFAEPQRKDEMLRDTYHKIEKIIRRLEADHVWRKEVTDVRNWLTFTAQEYAADLEHPILGRYYDSTGSLSGGEKAKLTYTILAAALSYQFGIKDGARSFRFLLVDEAFSKLDEDNAHYLLDLCETLHLQLVFGTPFPVAGLHVVEKKIGAIFFVEKKTKNDKPYSVLHSMSIGQFLKDKEKFLQTT
ncbi:MAG TPA: SbcC/MukB-like Walker B domain-containing protein, partial [Saprospiraceae bacterium]|nr:SbcC/MukB-like Walker B domain-containing protein [Saprospiraceae bacterium]